MLPAYKSFQDSVFKIKTKQYTYSRISRALFHILLGITGQDMDRSAEAEQILFEHFGVEQ